jgi:hypothetical protein
MIFSLKLKLDVLLRMDLILNICVLGNWIEFHLQPNRSLLHRTCSHININYKHSFLGLGCTQYLSQVYFAAISN